MIFPLHISPGRTQIGLFYLLLYPQHLTCDWHMVLCLSIATQHSVQALTDFFRPKDLLITSQVPQFDSLIHTVNSSRALRRTEHEHTS